MIDISSFLSYFQLDIMHVLDGSALKNVGVQPLLDAIALYLPSPLEATPMEARRADSIVKILPTDKHLCALAFKVCTLLLDSFLFSEKSSVCRERETGEQKFDTMFPGYGRSSPRGCGVCPCLFRRIAE